MAATPNKGRTRADIDRLVRGVVMVRSDHPEDEARVEKIIDRIHETGECVWHAACVIAGAKCVCADCAPQIKRII